MSAINLSRALCNCHTLYFGQHYQDLFVTESPSPVSCVTLHVTRHRQCPHTRMCAAPTLARRSHIMMIEVFLNMYVIRPSSRRSLYMLLSAARSVIRGHKMQIVTKSPQIMVPTRARVLTWSRVISSRSNS